MNIGQTPDSASGPTESPADTQPAAQSADTRPAETQPAEARTADAQAADTQQPGKEAPPSSAEAIRQGAAPQRPKGPLAARGASFKPESPAARPLSPAARAKRDERPKSAERGPATETRQPSSDAGRPHPKSDRRTGPSGDTARGEPGDAASSKPAPQRAKDAPRSEKSQRPAESAPAPRPPKLAVPNLRQPLSGDLQAELERELAAAAELDAFLGGSAGMAARKEPLQEGQRVHGTVLKIHEDSVFVSLGGPDEGVVPFEQFTSQEPQPGDPVEVIVRGTSADGLYALNLPGETVSVADWSDIENGSLVEVTVSGANSGGLECKVAGIDGFIPISQISEHRVEDTSEFVGQKFVCVVTESNPRRGNLVLSRRAVLEREREEKRREQLEKIQPGDLLEGVVRTVKDFGAFVDLGGLEGLIHVSKLSWERIKHPSEVIEPGQKVKVKVDKIDPQTGKISLSYRDLLENPWDRAAETITPGTVMTGTVTRTAAFGAFVRLAAGVEGLVHISEVAGHRVSNVSAFLKEGQEVEVKVLSIDRDSQKISLSIKQAHHKAAEPAAEEVEEEIEVRQPIIKPTHQGPLRGGTGQESGGERFGLRW